MDYIGKWKICLIGSVDEENGLVYMTPEEYLSSPMPSYVDESDPEAVESELRDRRSIASMTAEFCSDGTVYFLIPFPEYATKEEIDEAIASGEVKVRDGMILGDAVPWELRDGEAWVDLGIEGEVMGEKADTFVKALDDDGLFAFLTMKFIKE